MKNVDALSRNPVMIITCGDITTKIEAVEPKDEYITTLIKLLENGRADDYFNKINVFCKYDRGGDLLAIPKSMQAEVIKNAHENEHFAVAKIEELVKYRG